MLFALRGWVWASLRVNARRPAPSDPHSRPHPYHPQFPSRSASASPSACAVMVVAALCRS